MAASDEGWERMTESPGSDSRLLPELLSELSGELSTLVHQEMQLARVELRREMATTAKGSAALVVAAVGGLLTIVFGTSAAAWGLAQVMAAGWAFLIVTLVWLLITSVAGVVGLRKLKQVGPPTQTVQSLKEDVAWAKTRKS
jgi:uncharacterized membrane protein YqjE